MLNSFSTVKLLNEMKVGNAGLSMPTLNSDTLKQDLEKQIVFYISAKKTFEK